MSFSAKKSHIPFTTVSWVNGVAALWGSVVLRTDMPVVLPITAPPPFPNLDPTLVRSAKAAPGPGSRSLY